MSEDLNLSSKNLQSPSSNSSNGDNSENKAENVVFSVEALNRQIRQLIEGSLNLVWVQGELSNFKPHTSGHFYFSLKDSKSQITAVMFRGFNSRLKFRPTDGMEVIVRARVTVYEPRGNYQLVCETMEPVGAGALQKAFEQLKEKLKSEGLFNSARKRAIPSLARHVAIVTSPTGAAIQDILNILGRRNKSIQVTVVPTVVQGEGCGVKVSEALKLAWKIPDVDVIIVGRGGGSMEDLWGFNDETLARTIAASPIPVISAVGHEVDFTIADFVADLRAPTPSAAAELVSKNVDDLLLKIKSFQRLLFLSIQKKLKTESQKMHGLDKRLIDPKRKLMDLMQRNDELLTRLQLASLNLIKTHRLRVQVLRGKMISPTVTLKNKNQKLATLQQRLQTSLQIYFDKRKHKLKSYMFGLDSLSPLRVVDRGYAIVQKNDNQSMGTATSILIRSAKQVEAGDLLSVQLAEGSLQVKVQSKIEKQ